jgi:hypothetical protein
MEMMTFVSRTARIAAGGFGALSPMRWHDLSLSAQSQGFYCSVARLRVESLTTHGGWSENQHSVLCGDIEVVGLRNILQCILGQPLGSSTSFLRA